MYLLQEILPTEIFRLQIRHCEIDEDDDILVVMNILAVITRGRDDNDEGTSPRA
jgi:hypothetical protein